MYLCIYNVFTREFLKKRLRLFIISHAKNYHSQDISGNGTKRTPQNLLQGEHGKSISKSTFSEL